MGAANTLIQFNNIKKSAYWEYKIVLPIIFCYKNKEKQLINNPNPAYNTPIHAMLYWIDFSYLY